MEPLEATTPSFVSRRRLLPDANGPDIGRRACWAATAPRAHIAILADALSLASAEEAKNRLIRSFFSISEPIKGVASEMDVHSSFRYQ